MLTQNRLPLASTASAEMDNPLTPLNTPKRSHTSSARNSATSALLLAMATLPARVRAEMTTPAVLRTQQESTLQPLLHPCPRLPSLLEPPVEPLVLFSPVLEELWLLQQVPPAQTARRATHKLPWILDAAMASLRSLPASSLDSLW